MFRFNVQSSSDIITNSSSELFVFNNDSVKDVVEILDNLYPNWKSEYEEPIKYSDQSIEDKMIYLYFVFISHQFYLKDFKFNPDTGLEYSVDEQFELYCKCFENYYKTTYGLDKESINKVFFITLYRDDYFNDVEIKINPLNIDILEPLFKDDIALYSIYENPDWEYQEKLSKVAKRYHLG